MAWIGALMLLMLGHLGWALFLAAGADTVTDTNVHQIPDMVFAYVGDHAANG